MTVEAPSLLIIIPTYNESENITTLVTAIQGLGWHIPFQILIVDDNSPDGTGSIADALSQRGPSIHVLHRPGKQGLGKAYIAGFRWGLKQGFSWLVEMDADLSHDPSYLLDMERYILSDQYDYLIGSRYIPGGGTQNWGLIRRLISRFGGFYATSLLRCPIQDFTGGFNAWKTEVLKSIDLDGILSDGYGFQIEMKYKAFKKGFRFIEFPIVFVDRTVGKSKMSKRIVWEALFKVLQLKYNS